MPQRSHTDTSAMSECSGVREEEVIFGALPEAFHQAAESGDTAMVVC